MRSSNPCSSSELTLRVADLAQVQAFYQDVLGFAP